MATRQLRKKITEYAEEGSSEAIRCDYISIELTKVYKNGVMVTAYVHPVEFTHEVLKCMKRPKWLNVLEIRQEKSIRDGKHYESEITVQAHVKCTYTAEKWQQEARDFAQEIKRIIEQRIYYFRYS